MPAAPEISLIVCPNGWGHFKRAAMLSASLISENYSVRIITRGDKWSKFCEMDMPYFDEVEKIEVEDCAWLPVAQDYEYGRDTRRQFDEMVKRQSGRLIISDNYPEPLLSRKDVVVLANFFWHEVFDMTAEYTDNIANALHDTSTKLATTIFGQPYIGDLPNVHYLPLFGLPKKQVPAQGYVIMALGFGAWTTGYEEYFQHFLDSHANELPHEIILDANLKGKFQPPRKDIDFLFRPFTQDLIAGAEAVIGRPSLGIVTDALALHVPIFPLADSNDVESMHNQKVIGEIYESLDVQACFSDRLAMRRLLKNKSPEFGGASALTDLIMNKVA